MQENTAPAAPAPPASARPPLMAAFRELAAWAATHGLRMVEDPATLSYADLEAAVDEVTSQPGVIPGPSGLVWPLRARVPLGAWDYVVGWVRVARYPHLLLGIAPIARVC